MAWRLLDFGDFRLGGRRLRLGWFRRALDSFFEAAEAFAQSFAKLGKFSRPKDEQGDDQDDDEMSRCEQIIEHVWIPPESPRFERRSTRPHSESTPFIVAQRA